VTLPIRCITSSFWNIHLRARYTNPTLTKTISHLGQDDSLLYLAQILEFSTLDGQSSNCMIRFHASDSSTMSGLDRLLLEMVAYITINIRRRSGILRRLLQEPGHPRSSASSGVRCWRSFSSGEKLSAREPTEI